jgi:hypothetical protein
MCPAYPIYSIILELITIKSGIFGEEYNLERPTLWIVLVHPIISSFIRPDIFLSTLFSLTFYY